MKQVNGFRISLSESNHRTLPIRTLSTKSSQFKKAFNIRITLQKLPHDFFSFVHRKSIFHHCLTTPNEESVLKPTSTYNKLNNNKLKRERNNDRYYRSQHRKRQLSDFQKRENNANYTLNVQQQSFQCTFANKMYQQQLVRQQNILPAAKAVQCSPIRLKKRKKEMKSTYESHRKQCLIELEKHIDIGSFLSLTFINQPREPSIIKNGQHTQYLPTILSASNN